jgi:hypothetical protein
MKAGSKLGLAVAAGYVLGRFRKGKWALALAAMGTGKKLPGPQGALLEHGKKLLASSPALSALGDEVGSQLAQAGKTAVTAAVSRRIESFSDMLRDRTDLLGGGGKAAGDGDDEPQDAEQEESEEGQQEDNASRPQRRTASRPRAASQGGTRPARRTSKESTSARPRTRTASSKESTTPRPRKRASPAPEEERPRRRRGETGQGRSSTASGSGSSGSGRGRRTPPRER